MANIKNYRRNISIPGLPDTTNIQDPQLRLYLDRLNTVFSNIQITIDLLKDTSNTKRQVSELLKDHVFTSYITQEAKKIAQKEAQEAIKINEKTNTSKNKVLKSIYVVPPSLSIKPGDVSIPLDVEYSPSGILSYQRGVTWNSSDENVATVDDNGNVTAIALGECVIQAVSTYNNNITSNCNVYVANQYYISVFASNAWSNLSGETVYTEMATPNVDDPAWNASGEITVTVSADLTEEEAKLQSADGIVSAVDERNFIVAEDKKVYWRNTEKDFTDDNYKEIDTSWYASVAGVLDSDQYVSLYLTLMDDTGEWLGVKELYSKAYRIDIFGDPSNATEEQKQEFSKQNCLIAENILFMPYKPIFYIISYKTRHWDWENWDEEWTEHFSGATVYMVATGKSVTLKYYDEFEDANISETWIEIQTYDGRFPCWINKEIWNENMDGGREIGCSTYQPYVAMDPDGYQYIHSGVDRDGDARVKKTSNNRCFEYDGVLYQVHGHINVSACIFDILQGFAWTVSPCRDEDETVYTVKEETPEEYGNISNGDFQKTGTVLMSGNGVFSITVNSEVFYSTANFGA